MSIQSSDGLAIFKFSGVHQSTSFFLLALFAQFLRRTFEQTKVPVPIINIQQRGPHDSDIDEILTAEFFKERILRELKRKSEIQKVKEKKERETER